MVSSDIFFFFENESLRDASPRFVSSIGIVNTQDADVAYENLFWRHMQLCERKHENFIKKFRIPFDSMKSCLKDFVLPFIKQLNGFKDIKEWPLWNIKQLTMQFFVILNSFMFRLQENCEINVNLEDPMDYPFLEMAKDVMRNLMLCSTTWSFGAVLNQQSR